MSLEEAAYWPDLIAIVREKVKPERDKLVDNADGRRRKAYWWQFGRETPALIRAIAPLKRCLANSLHTKHLVFAFQPTDRVFSHALNVVAFADNAHFAVLQSRVHEPWARLLSSSMRNDLRYAASDCFETFPFPRDATLAPTSAVEHTGKVLYETRAQYMVDTQQGLTQTYNRLKDPQCTEPRIEELRRLHEAMDRAVLDAYGWTDIAVPTYGTPVTAEGRRALERFEDEVIDRLFELNSQRAEEERTQGALAAKPRGPGLVKSKHPPALVPQQQTEEREARLHTKSASRIKVDVKKTQPPQPTRHKATGSGRKR